MVIKFMPPSKVPQNETESNLTVKMTKQLKRKYPQQKTERMNAK